MKLEIFVRATRTRIDMIRTYNFVQYVDEFNGMGSFSVTIPTNDESLKYLYEGNFIYFDEGVMGIIKGIRTSQDSDVEIEVYGFLTNSVLNQRVFEVTKKYYDTVPKIARSMVSDKFIDVGSEYRKMSLVTLAGEGQYFPVFEDKITFQNTGDTVFQAMSELFLTYNLGMEMYPVIANYTEDNPTTNLKALEFRILKPHDRTIDNQEGNTPVVFSFDLNNLSGLEYEEDGRTARNVVYVASEGEGEDRKVIEVGSKQSSGLFRTEGYVDARDLQTQSGGGSGGGGGGTGDGGSATVVGGAFEVAKWENVLTSNGWEQVNDIMWTLGYSSGIINTTTRNPLAFAINVPEPFVVNPRVIVSQYMSCTITVNGEQVLSKTGNTASYDGTPDIQLKAGVNNIVFEAWVSSGSTSTGKKITLYLYDFAADINTDGYLTTTADIWRPNVDESGDMSWTKSATTTPPQTRNIKGPQGDKGTSPHIDPATGHWMIGEVDTNVRADGIDGTTPHIDSSTGNWFIGTTDTGVHAQGPQGAPSTVPGPPGTSPTIVPSSGNTDSIYKLDVTTADGTFTTPNLRGQDGEVTKDRVPFKFGIDNSGDYGYYKNDEQGNPTNQFTAFGTGSGGSGLFGFEIREDGHLWMVTDDSTMADKFYINEQTGHLMYRME